MNLMNKKVGDLIYDSGVRSDLRMCREGSFFTVTKIAKKYLTACNDRGTEIRVVRETGCTNLDFNNFRLWESKEAYEEWKVCLVLSEKIVKFFGPFGRSVPQGVNSAQLQKILDILEGTYDG